MPPLKAIETPSLAPAGASAGIGEACAWRFAAEGCRLVLVARRQDRLEALASALQQHYSVAVHTVCLDVRDLPAIERLPQELPPEFQVADEMVAATGVCCMRLARFQPLTSIAQLRDPTSFLRLSATNRRCPS
jgi:NADP-dependent 3-hydroxy acid dehydrogenase YdfG